MTESPWDLLDDEVQAVLRPIFGQEFDRRLAPIYEADKRRRDAEADAQLAATIKQMATKYKDFGPRQAEILQFAVDHGVANLEIAYHALRSATSSPDASGRSAEPSEEERTAAERGEKRRARLEELRFKDDLPSQMERAKLQNEEEEGREEQAKKLLRGKGDGDEFRQQVIEEANAEADAENRLHTARVGIFGHHDSRRAGRQKTTNETRATMDLEAIGLVRAANRGESYAPKATRSAPTRNQRDRDAGFDVRDRAVLSAIRDDNASAQEIITEINSGATE